MIIFVWGTSCGRFFQTFCFVGGGNCFYPKWPKQDFQVMTEKPPIEVALFRFQNLPRLMLIAQQLLTHANSLDPTQKKGILSGELTVSYHFCTEQKWGIQIFSPPKKKTAKSRSEANSSKFVVRCTVKQPAPGVQRLPRSENMQNKTCDAGSLTTTTTTRTETNRRSEKRKKKDQEERSQLIKFIFVLVISDLQPITSHI